MTARVFHRERAGAALQPFFDHYEATGKFDVTVPPSGGNRTDADQLVEWIKGRVLMLGHDPKIEASWRIIDPIHHTGVVTYAFSAADSGHGHSGAADVVPVRTKFANGLPATVWLGNEENPTDRAEAVRLQGEITAIARAFGLECGADWAPPKTDPDHYQVPHWRDLPRFVRA